MYIHFVFHECQIVDKRYHHYDNKMSRIQLQTEMKRISQKHRTMNGYDDVKLVVEGREMSFCLDTPTSDYSSFITAPTNMAKGLSWLVRSMHYNIILQLETYHAFKSRNAAQLQSLTIHSGFIKDKVRILIQFNGIDAGR